MPYEGPVEQSVVRVFSTFGDVVGAGFLVGDGLVATCAHVVTAAVGGSAEAPTPPPAELTVDMPLLDPPHRTRARVHRWSPVARTPGVGDVAILRLAAPAPEAARIPPLYRPDGVWGHSFRVLGFPEDLQEGVWSSGLLRAPQGSRWLQLQSAPHGKQIVTGFSGSPVWDSNVEAVVGMTVTSLDDSDTTAYVIPIEDVLGVDPTLLPNPYRGLEPFGEEHADVFYGRAEDVDTLANTLERQPLVAVAGRSGTGKSSLVRAGLLPRLRRSGARIAELRPSAAVSPRLSLAAALASLLPPDLADDGRQETTQRLEAALGEGGDALQQVAVELAEQARSPGVVLFVDQFEELVEGDDPAPARELLQTLVDLVQFAPWLPNDDAALRVVLTLRWEAMNELVTTEVAGIVNRGTVALAPMDRTQLREAILGPTARAPGLRFDDGLVEEILDDAVDEPGHLPLVESLLTQLWEGREGGTLKSDVYRRLGRVRGAVARHANAVLAELGQDASVDMEAVRRLLTRLARPADGGGFVRRVARLDELVPDQQPIVDRLTGRRLLVTGRQPDGTDTVELAHQALIDHWDRLREWLEEDGEFLRWQQEVDDQRQVWERSGRDHGALLRGTALDRAEGLLLTRYDDIAAPLRELIDVSRAWRRRETRRRRGGLSALAVGVVATLVLGTLFVYQRQVAQREEAAATSRALAALSADLASSDPVHSALLALAAYQSDDTAEAQNALFRHYVDNQQVDTVLSGAPGQIAEVDASRDGRVVAARTDGGNVTVWTREPGRETRIRDLPDVQAAGLDVADDGSGILLLEVGEPIRVWFYDLSSGEERWEIPVRDGHDVAEAMIGDDGTVALHSTGASTSDSIEETNAAVDRLELWETSGDRPQLVGGFTVPWDSVGIVGFGPQPDTLAVQDFRDDTINLELWNAATGSTEVAAEDVDATTVLVTPDGLAASCDQSSIPRPDGSGFDDSVRLVDLRDGTQRRVTTLSVEYATCATMAADATGDVIAGHDWAIDVQSGELIPQPTLSHPDVTDIWDTLMVSPTLLSDGERRLRMSYDDTQIVLVELATEEPSVPAAQWSELSPEGEHMVSVTGPEIVVTSTSTSGDSGSDSEAVATEDRPEPAWQSGPTELDITDDGSLVADRVAEDQVEVRSLPDLERISEIRTAEAPDLAPEDAQEPGTIAPRMAFVGDRLLTLAGTRAQWWDPRTGELLAELDVIADGIADRDDLVSMAPHSDPSRVAVWIEGEPHIHIHDVATGRRVDTVQVGDNVIGAQFQPDSPYLAVLRNGRTIELWDAVQDRRVLGPLPSIGDSTEGAGFVVQFLPGPGNYFVGDGGRLRWYRADSGELELSLDLGEGRQPISMSANGEVLTYVYTSSYDPENPTEPGTPPLRLEPETWRDELCDLVERRTFDDDQMDNVPDGTPTAPLCEPDDDGSWRATNPVIRA